MAYYNGSYRSAHRQPQPQSLSCGCSNAAERVSSCSLSSSCHLAIAYVPWQKFENLFDEDKAFSVGTAFLDLYKPFMAGRKCR